ncbi:Electron transfer flavoprotein-ubiquinone oxidoreductase [Vibrio nigripulchritudo SFn27]|uniref:Electron transfer flavoprotein-ubiquinone oxidoreductase n=1 Tax=Vibrio nigripulchritudo TaxID=28173 RepID=U4KA65_9VIBR|nr:electron transfer flavoprotein-ubiquinone oxidoreductase [Vibrio nigripulchritudo]CCN83820.1 Electron transfer flavoprotein-ubiquinone oxidoreductase [Vibrio nigripulchritudo BLFn1]CCN87172.1 Electron transfer flavoprotein-ubiquinone oxidoreductase [Vibrio nigripulchritudo SFn27]CCN94528.1 Electron transfer flavoprotein-ubiquinone oxidoreductase [Vibrio nigripulchritudo ENn2]CCO40906.1 Electron transfer flavoprotein-ubiquinone oxidoreductase [Vibrio nigripulchritudo SFn135]CCO54985.1 Electr
MSRESMSYDVVIVGAGPAGLSAACKLKQLARQTDVELSVCVVEKGSEVGAHILSGAIIDPRALDELFPDWKELGAPLHSPVVTDKVYFLNNEDKGTRLPQSMIPKTLNNEGSVIASLGNLCRWLSQQAEELGVDVFSGFAAEKIIFDDEERVRGIQTGDMGLDAQKNKTSNYQPGILLEGKYTLFSEGCRGHLGKQLIKRFDLDSESNPQHYGLGFKELWNIDPKKHQEGLVIHGFGWPLSSNATGGFFLYHASNCQVVVGLIVDLDYQNPWLNPFKEFQRLKNHPVLAEHLLGGHRVSYGARSIAKGGLNALPKMTFPGGLLLGCDAGTLNPARLKGTHTAMKSGMLGAEVVYEAIAQGDQGGAELVNYTDKFTRSWVYEELYRARNFSPALLKFGPLIGGGYNWFEQNLCRGKVPWTLHSQKHDYAQMKPAELHPRIPYAAPDGKLSFDLMSSVYLSGTNHEENQPCHLELTDAAAPFINNLIVYQEPAQRYCPAGVYEVLGEGNTAKLQINAQNCLHCKTCDIKDPAQNIVWHVPQGGGGPNYSNM